MIYISGISIYLRISLIPKKYLYSFFRVWKCSKDGLLIYLFSIDVVNVISNYIPIFIHINSLIVVWNFLISSLNTYPRFLISHMVPIGIGEGLEYLVKLAFYKI